MQGARPSLPHEREDRDGVARGRLVLQLGVAAAHHQDPDLVPGNAQLVHDARQGDSRQMFHLSDVEPAGSKRREELDRQPHAAPSGLRSGR